jgi:hypothetical protein
VKANLMLRPKRTRFFSTQMLVRQQLQQVSR